MKIHKKLYNLVICDYKPTKVFGYTLMNYIDLCTDEPIK